MGIRSWLTTLGMGAGLMYFYDPQNGRRRRAQLRDQWNHYQNEAEDFWGKAQRDLENRAQGVQYRAQSLREKAGNLPGLNGTPGGDGSVRDVQENLRNVQQNARESVQGVKQSLQENVQGVRQGFRGQWSPGIRLLAGTAGGAVTLFGLTQRGLKGTAATLFGFNLIARSITNRTGLRGLISTSDQSQSITFDKTLTVKAPAHEVYEFWRNYQNFPRFMSHVQEVRDLGNGRSHWVVMGPAGQTVEWDAVTTEMEPDRVLAWESLPGAQVHNNGRVRFEQAGNDSTRVSVFLSYRPPAGVVGHIVASLFDADPKSAMDDDMARFKSLLETGKTSAGGRRVSKNEVAPGSQSERQDVSQRYNPQDEERHSSGANGQYAASAGGQRFDASETGGPQSTFSGPGDTGEQHGKSQAASIHSMGEKDSDVTSGAGRTDEVGHSGVYPASDANAPGDAEAHGMASWGQGDLGAAGYEESGSSELHAGADDADMEAGGTPGFDSMMPGEFNPPDPQKPDVYDASEDD